MKQFLVGIFLIATINLFAQDSKDDFKPNGKVHFKIFWNYHADFSENASKTSAFEIKRSYFGYKYNFSEEISAKITFDVGSNDAGSAHTAYLKIAQLDWKIDPAVKLSMGLIGNKQFKEQEDNWGYRYMFKSFQDENKFGSSADLGINVEFKISETLLANFLIFNGEGYKNVQDNDGNQRFGGSLIYMPLKGLTTKIYADSHATKDADPITNLGLSVGFDSSKLRVGAEYNQMRNAETFSSAATDHELDGLSFYTTYIINNKFQLFARFDQLSSNTLSGESEAWNITKDGNQSIVGLQFAPVKGVKFAINYQGFSFDNDALDNKSLVFMNVEFKL